MKAISASKELARFFDESTATFEAAVLRVARAMLDGRMRPDLAEEHLRRRITETMVLAHFHGRRRVLLEVDAAMGGRAWSKVDQDEASLLTPPARFASVIPQVPFQQAISDLASLEPRLGSNWKEVARMYQEGPAFAAVRSSSVQVTQRVQKAIGDLLESGQKLSTAEKVLAEIDDWSRAYAETVFRTNAATAYSAGRFEEANRPLVKKHMPAWEFFTAGDRDVRHNHAAGNGTLLATDDPRWRELAPPLGYQCRCALRLVSRSELERRGRLRADGTVIPIIPESFPAFHPDPGFEVHVFVGGY